MTIADKLREEGMEKGLKEGLKEGKEKELIETITVLLMQKLEINKFPDELKEKLNKADLETLKLIRNNLLQIKSLKELESYLN
jgi:predicted transposase YdaD